MEKLKQVNLIPKELLKKAYHSKLKPGGGKKNRLGSFAVIFFALLAILLSVIPLLVVRGSRQSFSAIKNATAEAKLKLEKLQSEYLELEKIKAELSKEKALKKEKLDQLLLTYSTNKVYPRLLQVVAGLLPQDLWFSDLKLKGNEAQIAGSTPDNQLVTQLMDKLDASGAFRSSRFISCEKQAKGSLVLYNFKIASEITGDLPASGGEVKDGD